MCVMIGDGKGNADERAGDKEELEKCYLLFPNESAQSDGDREFHAHNGFDDRDLPALEGFEIKEGSEECDHCHEPEERDFLDCEMLEVVTNKWEEGDSSEARYAQQCLPCADEAGCSLDEEIAETPAEECAEGEEEAHIH